MRTSLKLTLACVALLAAGTSCGLIVGLQDRALGQSSDGGLDSTVDSSAPETRAEARADGQPTPEAGDAGTDSCNGCLDTGSNADTGLDAGMDVCGTGTSPPCADTGADTGVDACDAATTCGTTYTCGSISNGCGGSISCGNCTVCGQTCITDPTGGGNCTTQCTKNYNDPCTCAAECCTAGAGGTGCTGAPGAPGTCCYGNGVSRGAAGGCMTCCTGCSFMNQCVRCDDPNCNDGGGCCN